MGQNEAGPDTGDVHTKELAYEQLGARFADVVSIYDTQCRIEVLIDDFLGVVDLKEKSILDVGCGLGFFSERLVAKGAKVVSSDISPTMVGFATHRSGSDGVVVSALSLVDRFGSESFDLVVSSECIEHTHDSREAVRQMIRVLRPGGYLSISTPNMVWSPVVTLATLLKCRPYAGYEHFSSWRGLRRLLARNGMQITREKGLHLWPFQVPLHRASQWTDEHLQWAKSVMINICMLARKRADHLK